MVHSSPSPIATSLLALTLFGVAGCSGSSSRGGAAVPTGASARLERIELGQLVDVYGFRMVNGTQVVELFERDHLAGPDIQDERPATSTKRDDEVLYDFLAANPDTLQPRLLITREIGSPEFAAAVAALDDRVRQISPNAFGRNSKVTPYSVVPRNAGFRIVFSQPLGIDEDFFYERDADGAIVGVKNTQAIQLLKIAGDPTDEDPAGDFVPIQARIAVRDGAIILDPVLLGIEGLQYGARNSASGLPASPNQNGANIRIAIATEGPLALGNVTVDRADHLNGRNNDGAASIIRDFRSGNENDNSPELARGFMRDPIPPRLIGHMSMLIERVEAAGDTARLLTIFKNGIDHELDRGDLIRVSIGEGDPIASLEILQEPTDDLGRPHVQRVRVLVRPIFNEAGEDILEKHDPSDMPGFPRFAGQARGEFLLAHAPRAVVIAEFTRRRLRPNSGATPTYYGDDPRNFLSFSPRPEAVAGVVVGNIGVSPFAGAILRFSKPVDMSTLVALDTAFFGTRDLLDPAAIEAFLTERDIDPTKFDENKFRTPHLIHSRIFDEDGSQTAVRIQPTLGFYLDEAMRIAAKEDEGKPFSERRYHYFLHLVSGKDGIADLSGNPLDFQSAAGGGVAAADHLVMEFELNARKNAATGQPRHEDNLAIYTVRRFASPDEDERPSLYLDSEITKPGALTPADGWRSDDFFGPISYLPTGEIAPRAATRVTKVGDNLNQQAAPPQTSELRWCPERGPSSSGWAQQDLTVTNTAATVFGAPIRNPINPFGCRLQMLWREIDLNLSRTDPQDFNLDVEQLYWAPFTQGSIVFDEFDRMTLYLGHSEFRPEACIASGDAFPSMDNSGLNDNFARNYAFNPGTDGRIEHQPSAHPAYIDASMTINPSDAILEGNGVNRYLPLPKFIDATKVSTKRNPFFVWRDEQEFVQGGLNGVPDVTLDPYPYLLSPFLGGKGRKVTGPPDRLQFTTGGWHNARDRQLRNGNMTDQKTGGCVGTIALPLLADFWTYPDDPDKPVENPFRASGINGWQVGLPVTSSAQPFFRAYSAGRGGASPQLIDPTHAKWARASGGYAPGGTTTRPRDNTYYWIMADFLKRTAVVTSGFVEIGNPHRMPATVVDPRLGPYDRKGLVPTYTYDFEPPLSDLPAGTSVVPEFRGASRLTRANQYWPKVGNNALTPEVFPLDPLKAGDAHIRHWDTRNAIGTSLRKRYWSYLYNDLVTPYTEDPNDLADSTWTNKFAGPSAPLNAEDVVYFNWRFIMRNNVEADPPVSPKIESFAVAYRLTDR